MTLYLVQHGQSFDKEIDRNRSLTPEGRAAILQVANATSNFNLSVSTIYHSGKLRALQTAELFSEQFKVGTIETLAGLSPLDSVKNFADHFHFAHKSMIIGHLPFMERLTSYLITGDQDKSVVKFQNAGIVCLEKDKANNWTIKWTIMPGMD